MLLEVRCWKSLEVTGFIIPSHLGEMAGLVGRAQLH